MPFEVSTEAGFSAAHFIRGYPGNCSNLHGHNWKVRITVRASSSQAMGLTYDFRRLRELAGEVVSGLDHSVLNDLPQFEGGNPTAETIAEWIYGELEGRLAGEPVRLARVEVWESERNCAAFFRE
jgi:6-pyruvoyltetrahydropterin/6-carboxytetrahydropterin synthase